MTAIIIAAFGISLYEVIRVLIEFVEHRMDVKLEKDWLEMRNRMSKPYEDYLKEARDKYGR